MAGERMKLGGDMNKIYLKDATKKKTLRRGDEVVYPFYQGSHEGFF